MPKLNPFVKSPETSKKSGWTANLVAIGLAIALSLLVTLFIFQSYRVDGESMENTLQNNDRLIIDKIPRTWARLTGHAYIPHRGDIIVFSETGMFDSATPQNKQLIKRVIGLPGDRVVIKNGQVTIYNLANPDGFHPDLSGWQLTDAMTTGNIDTTLGSNQLYVFGDNRPNSTDSRIFGPINANQVVGKLVLRFAPVNGWQVF